MTFRDRIKDAVADTKVTMCPEKLTELTDRLVTAQDEEMMDWVLRASKWRTDAELLARAMARIYMAFSDDVYAVIHDEMRRLPDDLRDRVHELTHGVPFPVKPGQ